MASHHETRAEEAAQLSHRQLTSCFELLAQLGAGGGGDKPRLTGFWNERVLEEERANRPRREFASCLSWASRMIEKNLG